MGIQNLSEDLLLVDLPHNPLMIVDELKAVNDIISTDDNCDVVVDFFKVEVITSSSISNLLILRNLLTEHGRRLILFNVRTVTKCIFVVAGLKEMFDFAEDKSAALSTVKTAPDHSAAR
jgi:anti-anti-sigma regulatory factor